MKSNILFVHLPRTGGTFIRDYGKATKYINYYANYKQRDGHLPAREIKEPDKWFKFGFIRNPFDWYVSQYFYFAGKKEPNIETGIFKGVDKGLWGTEFVAEFPLFKDWMFYGYTNRKKLPYFWLINIYDYMFYDKEGRLLLDYIGKFENLYKEVTYVLDINGIHPSTSLKGFQGNRNASKHKNYKEYYRVEDKEHVEEIDGLLLRRYGYKY